MPALLWDMDGVLFPDRGTTWMAELRQGDPTPYLMHFMNEDPETKGMFDAGTVKHWITNYNNGREITTYGELARFLTDLRHVYQVFTSEETTYTKNKILEGLTIGEIARMPQNINHNPGAVETVRELKRRGVYQALFSKSNGALVGAESRFLELDYAQGLPVSVGNEKHGFWYDGSSNLPPLYMSLTGMTMDFSKTAAVITKLTLDGIDPKDVVVIDDMSVEMLKDLGERGVTAVGFHNPKDTIFKTEKQRAEHLELLKAARLPVLENDLTSLVEIVFDHSAIGRYCQ